MASVDHSPPPLLITHP
jgi:SWI/SNF-related matrix-associated actin-dependent regulator of chromatin subfamily D